MGLIAALKRRREKAVVDSFHKLYYDSHERTWSNTSWAGVPAQKCPLDLWNYQEIIFEIKPDLIIECGTADGGSALFLASICDMAGNGRVITIDVEERQSRPRHGRVTYLQGSSVSGIPKKVAGMINAGEKVMVILDSDHHKGHVLEELKIYSRLVTKDSYLIVEDTNVNGHPVCPTYGPGPMEAIDEFLKENDAFVIDGSREKLFLTFNPRGYLKRIK